MNKNTIIAAACLLAGLPSLLAAAPSENDPPTSPIVPVYNDRHWVPARYAKVKQSMANLPCDVLFIGDSITEQWEVVGKKIWNEKFAPLKAVNFGVSGDRTEHILWRMEDTKLATTTPPKVCVLMVGTNNIGMWKGKQTPMETVEGVKKIVTTLLDKFPATHIVILETTPYGPDPKGELRILGEKVNAEIRKLNLPRTNIVNYNKYFLNPDKTFKPGLFKDHVHLTEQGYRVWSERLLPEVEKWLKKSGQTSPRS